MITKFQALVARESMADCYADDGTGTDARICTVVKIKEGNRSGVKIAGSPWILLVEFSDGGRMYRQPSDVTPSDTLRELIERGIYREDTMTWSVVVGGVSLSGDLKY